MEWVKRAWRGEERLWKVFWIYNFLGSIAFGVFFGLSSVAAALGWFQPGSPFLVGTRIIYFIYCFWVIVSEWRCGFNVNSTVWGYIVRVLVVFQILGLISNIVFTLFLHDPLSKHNMLNAGTFSSAPAVTSTPTDTGIVHSTHAEKCLEKMTEYAKQKGYDPVKYASQNEAWLQQCTSYLDAAGKPSR